MVATMEGIVFYHLLLAHFVFMSFWENNISHSHWLLILMNRPHFGHILSGCCEDSEFSSMSCEYTKAHMFIIDHSSL
jgi:hypothetical protein